MESTDPVSGPDRDRWSGRVIGGFEESPEIGDDRDPGHCSVLRHSDGQLGPIDDRLASKVQRVTAQGPEF